MFRSKMMAYVLVMILAIAITSGITTYATTGQKTITVNYDDIRIIIDGVEITPKDAGGSVVEPFTVDGTTYLIC